MSQKWLRSKRWDDEHIPAHLWPVKWLLRAFSSIWLAVILLCGVAIYGTLASVPLGLLALLPTLLVVGLTLAGTVAVCAGIPVLAARRMLLRAGASRATVFAATFLGAIVLGIGAAAAWRSTLWPVLRYDPATGHGLRFFASFVERYQSITLRRLPGMEMTELQFYGWWPLRTLLLLFVVNLVFATVRRIEFTFRNIGVLTVHTGIVVIALGSVYYTRLKQEGDMLLLAGAAGPDGAPSLGPAEGGFYDNTDVVLWLNQDRGWEQRRLAGVPRYNDYGLGAVAGGAPGEGTDNGRTLDIAVPAAPAGRIDGDLRFRVVGYASYAELRRIWVEGAPAPGVTPVPAYELELLSALGDDGVPQAGNQARVVGAARLIPSRAPDRVTVLADALGIECTSGMPEDRWSALAAPAPGGARHLLLVEVPAAGYRALYPAEPGQPITVGDTGFTLEVQELLPEPPMPLVTPGYEGATSSLAVVRVTPPPQRAEPAYDRWVYHRFPEIAQDLLPSGVEGGAPMARRAADAALRVVYIDDTLPQIYIDETPASADGVPPGVRAIVRIPGLPPRVQSSVPEGGEIGLGPQVAIRLARRIPHVERVETPTVVPDEERRRDAIGTHQHSAVAVEVRALLRGSDRAWTHTLWVPFSQYLGMVPGDVRHVPIPDGRTLSVVFGRRWHALPDLEVSLAKFEMFPYPHSDTPRDYRSELLITSLAPGGTGGRGATTVHATSLNAPLLYRVPFRWTDERPFVANALSWLVGLVAPNQYKFSQAGWDAQGWQETSARARRGEIPRAYATYTILGVGNNPGIYVIAAGSVMMSLGIPWAFYVKPWLVRREKRRIQAQLAGAGAAGPPVRRPPDAARVPATISGVTP